MPTAETLQSHRAPSTYEARDVVRPGLPTAVRLGGVVAGLLAFGVLGLLVGVWHLTRGGQPADPACRDCRRRRGLAVAGTFVLAGLVLAGSGMAVHQQVSGPSLPHCGGGLPERATTNAYDSPAGMSGGVWLQARQALTAPVSGLTRHYVDNRGGGLCQGGSMTLAFLPSAASDSSVAVGSVVLTGDQSAMQEGDWRALARHESRHVTQWAALTLTGGPLAMPVLYAVDGAFFPGARNHFERAAGLEDGGYQHPEGYGPRPRWASVGVIGALLLAIGWRRLRWISRGLAGGGTAAAAHQPGLCPLHSRGWFWLPAAR